MSLDREAIMAREAAATPGPWHSSRPTSVFAGSIIIAGCMPDYHAARNSKSQADHNAEFIAHARTDIPALLAEVERLEHELKETTEAFELARAGSWSGWKDLQ